MDFPSQQDYISIEALRHCVEAGNHEIEQFRNESADMCLKMKESIDKHCEAASNVIDSITTLLNEEKEIVSSFNEVKTKLEKLCTTQSEFYERELSKYSYGAKDYHHNTANMEDRDNKENIQLCSLHDTLDKRIKEYQNIIFLQQQHQDHQQ